MTYISVYAKDFCWTPTVHIVTGTACVTHAVENAFAMKVSGALTVAQTVGVKATASASKMILVDVTRDGNGLPHNIHVSGTVAAPMVRQDIIFYITHF